MNTEAFRRFLSMTEEERKADLSRSIRGPTPEDAIRHGMRHGRYEAVRSWYGVDIRGELQRRMIEEELWFQRNRILDRNSTMYSMWVWHYSKLSRMHRQVRCQDFAREVWERMANHE